MQFAATEKVRLEVLRLIWDAYVGAKWQGHVKIDSREMNDLYRHDGGRKKVVAKKETGAEEDGSKKHGAKKYGSKKEG